MRVSEQIIRSYLDQAAQALNSGQPQRALQLADEARDYDATLPEAVLIRAIALSQMQHVEEATAAFEQAQALDPDSAAISYNFAVHLQAVGKLADAKREVNRALSQMPAHQSARQLQTIIEQQLSGGEPTFKPKQPAPVEIPPMMQGEPYRSGYEAPEHSFRWIENMGATWSILGWCVAGLGMLSFAAFMVAFWPTISQAMATQQAVQAPQKYSPFQLAVAGLNWLALIGSIIWMLTDILDRKANLFWLVPIVLCGCLSLEGLPLMLYMLLGRGNQRAF